MTDHPDSKSLFLQRLRKVCVITLIVAILNFASFVAVSIYLGGDAFSGGVKDGHYYIYGNHFFGQKSLAEVSERTFKYSKWHVYSNFLLWPLAAVAAVVLNRTRENS